MMVWVEYKKHATMKIGIKTPGGVNMVKRLLAWPLIALFSIISFTVIAEAATIEFFAPKGTTKKVRQVKARFSDQMVAFGDPRLSDPFEIKCPERGTGRWVDGKNWSYDFDKDLSAGVSCTFTLKQGLKTLAGKSITGQTHFRFNTGGPAVIATQPYEGDENIDEQQRFIFTLDGDPDEASLIQNVYCSVDGIKERVGIRLITGAEKLDFLKTVGRDNDKRPTVVFDCRRQLSPESRVDIVWGKGVTSKSNISTAKDQKIPYKTRTPFSAAFRCMREDPKAQCMPLSRMNLEFSAPVPWDFVKEITLKNEKGQQWKPLKMAYSHATAYLMSAGKALEINQKVKNFTVQHISFEGPFPENTSFMLTIPKGLKDDAGRRLTNENKFPLKVVTHGYPPLAKFSGHFGIIEHIGDAALPVTVRSIEETIQAWANYASHAEQKKSDQINDNTEKPYSITQEVKGKIRRLGTDNEEAIIEWLKRLRFTDRRESVLKGTGQETGFTIPKPGPSKEFEVIGIPLKDTGFSVVEIESKILGERLLGKPEPIYVPTSALVTNLAAHFKWGRESSVVWVTSLDKAQSVSSADVTLRDCSGNVIWQGKTNSDGIAKIDSALPSKDKLSKCPIDRKDSADDWTNFETSSLLSGIGSGIFVFARKDNDLTFTHSSWTGGIDPWRFNLPIRYGSDDMGNTIVHTVFDRQFFRAGETVSMKHFVRKKDMAQGFTFPSGRELPDKVIIQHIGTDQEYSFPIEWSTRADAETVWKIPQNVKLGTYRVFMPKKGETRQQRRAGWDTGSFQVEEFRIPLMRATVKGPKDAVVKAKDVDVDISLAYLSGGGASFAPVKLRSEVRPRFITYEDYSEYIFSNGFARKHLVKPLYEEEGPGLEEDSPVPTRRSSRGDGRETKLKTLDLTLDATGSVRTRLADLPEIDAPRDILAELEFRDPNGETQTVSSRIGLYPAKVHTGISIDKSGRVEDPLVYKIIALDLQGKPVSDAEAKVSILKKNIYSHRRRVAGGFYSFESTTEIIETGTHCQGKTDTHGILFCEGKSPIEGEIILQAEVLDDLGNISAAYAETSLYGEEDQWFEAGDDDRIDLIPEKKHYEPGEKARLQVKMPFKEATALVTIEREGVIDTHIQRVTRNNPVVEIPVKNSYSPNIFISAFLVRSRVSDAKPTAAFDPGKPAYKMGIAELRVGWQKHELKVNITTDKKAYRVRQNVDAKIKVTTALGKAPPKGSELTIAAVDEGLLELKDNKSWKLLEAMMARRPYEITTSTAQMMVVGKRHFGRKAFPHGGGGGKQTTRELFDTLLLWRSTVPLNENGEATVRIPLNDSLTSFRIVAVAFRGASLFGTGFTTVSTTQDLMVISGIPPVIRQGDRFTAGFTIRNTSDHLMDIEAALSLTDKKERKELKPLAMKLPAGESREIGWDITAPATSTEKLLYEVKVTDRIENISDTVKVNQKVTSAVPVRTFQATLTQLKEPHTIAVQRPSDALPSKGGVNVTVKPKIAEGLSGITEYMKDYPYICFEQKASKAVALRDPAMWGGLMNELPSYLDGDGLVKYFPVRFISGNDTLTSYILSISHEAGYQIPKVLKEKMMAGLKGFIQGRVVRFSHLPTADLSIRKLSAVEALSRYNEAQANLLDSITIEPNLWPTSAILDWINILSRVSNIPERAAKLKRAQSILRSRLNFQGTVMNISTERSDYCWWLMVSPDTNAIKTLLTTLQFDSWNEDSPRIARGIVSRLRKGHWNTTVANAWGILAMEKFSKKFESVPVRGITQLTLAEKGSKTDWNKTPKGDESFFSWPQKKEVLVMKHQGSGRPWATIQSLAAIPLKKPLSSGFTVKKTLTPVEQKLSGKWTRGDVARIRLEIDSRSDMTWIVVNDPIPAGATILGGGLGRDSTILTGKEAEKGWAREVFRERSFEAMRAYFQYVAKGKFTVEYTMRLNNEGMFNLPQTRVEALYSPEMFGELPNAKMVVLP